ncbi:MAG: alcohol dehydrogenase catalytic domain-containing protein, partial [Verrucomicrobia bacterium]|nr:alcohol dehydrogenase catalytic domain-containing protein [Verrucomicrobiota bacterium]
MKVIALEPGTTHLRLADKDQPKIQKDDEILAKVVSVGICGTDREETEGGRADAPSGEKELIIGHEMLSKVVEVGKKVTSVKPGDHVVFTVRRGCDNCPACLNARSDMCLTGNYTERGIKGRHGFHAEYVVDQECYAVKVPESIIHIAVLTEPMSVVQKAIEESILLQMTRLPYLKNNPNWLQGKKVLVAGMGTIGLLASIVLRLKGADVFGLDIIDKSSPRAQ